LSGDVDLFLVGVPDGEELPVLSKIYEIVMGACKDLRGEDARLLVTRSASAVTLFRYRGAPIQVILSTYNSTEDLLTGFDIDAACCAYVLDTGKFVCSPRGRLALEYRVNTMQSQHHSRSYVQRLEKYSSRHFAIGLPGLETSLLSPDLLLSSYVWIRKKDLLLKVLSSCDENAPGLSLVTMPSGSKVREVRCRKQRARRVSGVQRLIVLTLATKRVREVDMPYVGKSASNSNVLDVHGTDGPMLLHAEECIDEYFLLWGVVATEDSDDDDDSAEEDDDGVYSVTPAAKAVMLFESCLKQQTEQLAREQEAPCDDHWSRGGFVFQVAKRMKSSPHCAVKSLVDCRIHTQLARRSKLSFVYDFVDSTRKFDSLNYVRDAARKPLQDRLSSEEFVQLYGLPKTLCFVAAAERATAPHNYWGDLYGP
jgi:hypothetical protein